MTPRIYKFRVKNYRSIGNYVHIDVPQKGPLVLIGENNAGKSNITRALDIVLGERWPGSITLEDHDFFGRDPDGMEVKIQAAVTDLACPSCGGQVTHLTWAYDLQAEGDATAYRYGCDSCSRTYPNKAISNALTLIRIDADRRLSYQLSYGSKYTLLSKLMHRFHEQLTRDDERKETLEEIFDALLHEFGQVQQFQVFRELLAKTAESFGLDLSYRLDIDFSAYDPSNFFRSLRVHPKMDGEVRSFDELGTGQEQILALAFSYAYAKAFAASEGLVLVIDEPEAHLHPAAQQWLASQLDQLNADGLQVILTTHSPLFVQMSRLQNIVLVRKPDGERTEVVQLNPTELVARLVDRGADSSRTGVDTIGPFYEASATVELKNALFSRACVLVEGQTEAYALPALLASAGCDLLREGVSVVSVEGMGNIAKWYRLFDAFEIPVYSIFDTDSNQAASDSRNTRAKHEDIFAAMNLSIPAEWVADTVDVHDRYSTFDPTFEPAVSNFLGPAWDDLYAEAASTVGASKALRARWAAQRVEVPKEARVTLAKLGTAILALLSDPSAPSPTEH